MTNKIVDLTLSGVVDQHRNDAYHRQYKTEAIQHHFIPVPIPSKIINYLNIFSNQISMETVENTLEIDIYCCLCNSFISHKNKNIYCGEDDLGIKKYMNLFSNHEICNSCRSDLENDYFLMPNIQLHYTLEDFICIKTGLLKIDKNK